MAKLQFSVTTGSGVMADLRINCFMDFCGAAMLEGNQCIFRIN